MTNDSLPLIQEPAFCDSSHYDEGDDVDDCEVCMKAIRDRDAAAAAEDLPEALKVVALAAFLDDMGVAEFMGLNVHRLMAFRERHNIRQSQMNAAWSEFQRMPLTHWCWMQSR